MRQQLLHGQRWRPLLAPWGAMLAAAPSAAHRAASRASRAARPALRTVHMNVHQPVGPQQHFSGLPALPRYAEQAGAGQVSQQAVQPPARIAVVRMLDFMVRLARLLVEQVGGSAGGWVSRWQWVGGRAHRHFVLSSSLFCEFKARTALDSSSSAMRQAAQLSRMAMNMHTCTA